MVNATIRFSDLCVMEITLDEDDFGADDIIGKLYYRAEDDEDVFDIVLKNQSDGGGGGGDE